MNYVQKAIELRNERLVREERLRNTNSNLRIIDFKNKEVYELLKQFNELVISYNRKILVGWSDGVPCLRFAGDTLLAYYDHVSGEYFLSFDYKNISRHQTLSLLMEAVTLEVSKL